MQHYTYLFSKRSVAVRAALAILALASPLAGQVDLGLNPMRVEFPAVPGRAFSGSLTLSNGGTAKTRVRTELLDVYVDEQTTPQFVPNATAENDYSCRSWLSVNPMELEIGPRAQEPIRFTVRVPEGASERGYHCAVGFQSLPTVTDQSETGLRTAVRLIAVFYPTVGKPAIHGEIKELKLEPVAVDSGVQWRAVVIMENSGLMMYRPVGSLEILDSAGKTVESQNLAPFPALPMRLQRYVLALKDSLAPGQYTMRARIDVGKEIQEASAVVTVQPPRDPAAPEVPPK